MVGSISSQYYIPWQFITTRWNKELLNHWEIPTGWRPFPFCMTTEEIFSYKNVSFKQDQKKWKNADVLYVKTNWSIECFLFHYMKIKDINFVYSVLLLKFGGNLHSEYIEISYFFPLSNVLTHSQRNCSTKCRFYCKNNFTATKNILLNILANSNFIKHSQMHKIIAYTDFTFLT